MKKILYIGSEALPFVSTGGLGDVLGSLPAAMAKNENLDVRVVIPLYSCINKLYRNDFKKECEFNVKLSWRNQYCGIYSYTLEKVKYYFIENEYYFKRETLYANYDDGERYAYFCRAALDMLEHIDFIPDIIHANDWHSALSIIYLRQYYKKFKAYSAIKSVFTIHNIEYQGIYDFSALHDVFALEENDRNIVDYNANINLLKGAIECCDVFTTVSEKYAMEIQDDYYSAGLHHIIRRNKQKLTGVVNGIDTSYYNPLCDNDIAAQYCVEDMQGKQNCKLDLQSMCQMKISPNTPIIAMVSRLAHHKGFDLVKCVMEELLSQDIQFVLLGTGEFELECYFKDIALHFPDKTGIFIEYDKKLSKKIYAGADMFLMPSLSEPCGLAQMIAARYGTVPIVRRTGGLYDTIIPFNSHTASGNGFAFEMYNAHEMLYAVKNAVSAYYNGELWNKIIKNAMSTDFSWEKSALKYIDIYNKI